MTNGDVNELSTRCSILPTIHSFPPRVQNQMAQYNDSGDTSKYQSTTSQSTGREKEKQTVEIGIHMQYKIYFERVHEHV